MRSVPVGKFEPALDALDAGGKAVKGHMLPGVGVLAVAIAFGKRHAHVMRTINAMRASQLPEIAEHYRTNFGLVDFMDAKGERRPMYRMTTKGLSELAMGFAGDDAGRSAWCTTTCSAC